MKILIIGQAPPAKQQKVPYDTTLLYDILSWVGISKQEAQEMFEFEAMTNVFPGKVKSGHKTPTISDMYKHYTEVLAYKMSEHKKVIVLGAVAKTWLLKFTSCQEANIFMFMLHPSRRNYKRIMDSKDAIINDLQAFINL